MRSLQRGEDVVRLGAVVGCLFVGISLLWAQTTYYGVQAQRWYRPYGLAHFDYDADRQRFVVHYNFVDNSPRPVDIGTIDLYTKAFSHLAQIPGNSDEVAFAVNQAPPLRRFPYAPGTVFVPNYSGEIYAIDPDTGNRTLLASGLPPSPRSVGAVTVRQDTAGIADYDLFYANATRADTGTAADLVRLDVEGNVVWSRSFTGDLESLITLGENPRWGPLQNLLVVGDGASGYLYGLDPATGDVVTTVSLPFRSALEDIRIYPGRGRGGDVALYVSHGYGLYQLTGLDSIPNLQPGDLFIQTEVDGRIWHMYFDPDTGNPVFQQIAQFGYACEGMVFAPVPEPASGLLLMGLLGGGVMVRRRRK